LGLAAIVMSLAHWVEFQQPVRYSTWQTVVQQELPYSLLNIQSSFDHVPSYGASLLLTPLKLIERLAALIPPPRRHRDCYYGVLAPNAPRLALARGPSLWALPVDDHSELETNPQAQPAPDYEFDQRVA
jgi:hypothetical protein